MLASLSPSKLRQFVDHDQDVLALYDTCCFMKLSKLFCQVYNCMYFHKLILCVSWIDNSRSQRYVTSSACRVSLK